MFAGIEEKLVVFGLVLLLIMGCVFAYTEHIHAEDNAKDAAAVSVQLTRNAAQALAYQKQLGDADAQHQTDLKAIADAASKPAPRILCHAASSSPVSSVPAPSSGVPAASGNAGDVRAADYDPLPALTDLSAAYERRVETARDALNRWPGAPPL